MPDGSLAIPGNPAMLCFTPKNPKTGGLFVLEFLTLSECDSNTWKEGIPIAPPIAAGVD
jgi:hypothetical protein